MKAHTRRKETSPVVRGRPWRKTVGSTARRASGCRGGTGVPQNAMARDFSPQRG